MTFLAPGFFLASLAAAVAVVALHFIVTRQPKAGVLPTARFVPDLQATSTARATRPSDLLLMLLRVLLVLAVGAGLARPIFKPARSARARVILVDASSSVRDIAALRDSARQYYMDGDAVIEFDSSARALQGKASDSLANIQSSKASGRLSPALIAAFRAASGIRDNADSLELVVISPFDVREIDAATDSIRILWPGRARLVKAGVGEAPARAQPERLQLRGAARDPLAISVAKLGTAAGNNSRIVRDARGADDSVWLTSGHALIEWPANDRPLGAVPRAPVDTIGGVVTGGSLVISAFPRKWAYPADSIRGAAVVARWADGQPAAVEWPQKSGCTRSVSVPLNPVGDLALSSDFVRFVGAIARRCSDDIPYVAVAQAEMASLAGRGSLASHDDFKSRDDVRSLFAPWLLAVALLAAIAELLVRRRRSEAVSEADVQRSRLGRAA